MPGQIERTLVRILIGAALCIALIASVLVPVPEDVTGSTTLPAVAFGQTGIYRLEVALLVFYGGLLIVTPTYAGLVRGRLPIEISARGAKFAEEADQSAEFTETAIQALKQTARDLTDDLAEAKIEIDELREQVTVRDRQ